MTSSYDEPGNPDLPHPATLRAADSCHATWVDHALDPNRAAAAALEHIDPAPVSTASTAATSYNVRQLDAAGVAQLLALVDRFDLDPRTLSPVFHVGRTRRGYVLMLTTYDVNADGDLLHVLGAPVVRHHLQPVGADELPAVCRTGRAA